MLEILNDSDFEKFRKLIYDESGITFSATNRSILDSRIKELLRQKNIATPTDYYALVTGNSEEMKEMLDSITTNLTRFFRNQPHFDAFINYVIPDLIERKKSDLSFPLVVLTASGGHNDLYLIQKEPLEERIPTFRLQDLFIYKIGYTLDDASGESFDKVSKML